MKTILTILALCASLPGIAAPKLKPVDQALLDGFQKAEETDALRAIERGANPNTRTPGGDTALMVAAECAANQVARALVARGAKVDARDAWGHTALMKAAVSTCEQISQLTDIANLLLDHHADINARDKDGKTPLIRAADAGHIEIATLLVNRGADANVPDNTGRTALSAAAQQGSLDLVSLLLDHKADPKRGSPLFFAVYGQTDRPDIVRLLILRGADVNAGNGPIGPASKNPARRTALEWMSETPLGLAIDGHRRESAKLLIDAGADVKAGGRLGTGLLSSAVMCEMWSDDPTLVGMLLGRGADPNEKNEMGGAIFTAARSGSPKVLQLLLEHGARANARDLMGNTPLMVVAQEGGHMRAMIAQVGYDHPESDKVFHPTKEELAVTQGETKAQDALCVKELVAKGADPNAKTVSGQTALTYAAKTGNAAVAKALLDGGANVDLLDGEGMTPLMWAAEGGWTDVVKVLLDEKCGVNVRASDGATALQLAQEAGKTEAAGLLQAAGGMVLPPVKPVITSSTLFTVEELPMDEVSALNDRGDVVGAVSLPPTAANHFVLRHADVWHEGKQTDLGSAAILALLDDGRVIVQPDTVYVNRRTQPSAPPFIWKNGVRSALPSALRLATTFSPKGDAAWVQARRAYMRHGGKTVSLEVPKGMEVTVNAVNDRGEVLGHWYRAEPAFNPAKIYLKKPSNPGPPQDTFRTVLWRQGKLVARWRRQEFNAFALNNSGILTGSTGNERASRPALWSNGRLTRLVMPQNAVQAEVAAVNNRGDAVGEAEGRERDERGFPSRRAVFWRNGKAVELTAVIPGRTGWRVESARTINQRGEIAAMARRNGVRHAVLLRPIMRDETASAKPVRP